MDGISTLYAVSGKFALYEFLKVLASFCLVLFLLAIAPGRVCSGPLDCHAPGDLCGPGQPGEYRYALHPVDQCPVLALLRAVYPGLQRSLRGGGRCPHDLHFEKNPNVFAGCVGIAVLLSLGLIQSSKTNWENAYTRSCFLNALAFVLAFSMGQPGPSPSLSWPFWRWNRRRNGQVF